MDVQRLEKLAISGDKEALVALTAERRRQNLDLRIQIRLAGEAAAQASDLRAYFDCEKRMIVEAHAHPYDSSERRSKLHCGRVINRKVSDAFFRTAMPAEQRGGNNSDTVRLSSNTHVEMGTLYLFDRAIATFGSVDETTLPDPEPGHFFVSDGGYGLWSVTTQARLNALPGVAVWQEKLVTHVRIFASDYRGPVEDVPESMIVVAPDAQDVKWIRVPLVFTPTHLTAEWPS